MNSKRNTRSWRVLIPRHSTVAAYAALVLAMGGTAAAATGATFMLGHANKAKATSGLTNSGKGPALSLKTSSGKYAPLSVSSKTMVTNLNSNYLGGLAASGFGSVESASISVPQTGLCSAAEGCNFYEFGPISGISTGTATQSAAETLTPSVPLVARDLSVQVSTAPGSADVVAVAVLIGTSSDKLNCAVTGAAVTTCTDSKGAVAVPAGSEITIEVDSFSAPDVPVPAETVLVGFRMAAA